MVVLDHHRLTESWTWYGFSSLVFIWRLISRSLLLGGVRHLSLADYTMVATFAVYTNFVVWVNIQATYNQTNIIVPPTTVATMSQSDIDFRVYGSIVTFVLEQSMLLIQWGCKICMILLFYKLTSGLREQIFVRLLLLYVAGGFVLVEVFFLGIWCRPMTNYFIVADDNDSQCETSGHHLIMSYVFNVSSDLLMLVIPFRIFIRSQLPWKKKTALCAVFSLGIFVIIAATVNRYLCFVYPDDISWIFWYVREASTAIIVTNLPSCYTLLRYITHMKERSHAASRLTHHHRDPSNRANFRPPNPNQFDESKKPWSLRYHNGSLEDKEVESEETIARKGVPLQIWQHREFHIDINNGEEEIRSCDDDWDDRYEGRVPPGFSVTTKSTVTSGHSDKDCVNHIA